MVEVLAVPLLIQFYGTVPGAAKDKPSVLAVAPTWDSWKKLLTPGFAWTRPNHCIHLGLMKNFLSLPNSASLINKENKERKRK